MATATTIPASSIGYSIYSQLTSVQTSTAQDPHTKAVYASDGTHLTALLASNSSSIVKLLKIVGTSDGGSTLTTSNVAVSSVITLDGPTSSSGNGWDKTTYTIWNNVNGQPNRAGFAPIAIDTSDNLYIPLVSSYGTCGEMAIYKITKPTVGWSAWVAAGGTTTLSTTKMVSHAFASNPVNGGTPNHIFSAQWTTNGWLVFIAGATTPSNNSPAFLVFNATTGAYVGNSTAFNGYNNTYFGINDVAIPYLGAPGGGLTFFSTSSTTSTGLANYLFWQVDTAGAIYWATENLNSRVIGSQTSYANGGEKTNANMITWVDTNKFMIIAKNNVSPYYMNAAILQVEWYTADNKPGGTTNPYIASVPGATVTSTNNTFGAVLTQNWFAQAQTFPEERIVRIFQSGGNTLYYQDINYNSSFGGITYEASPFSAATGGVTSGAMQTIFEAAYDNKILYYGISTSSGATTIDVNYEAQNANRAITFSLPSTGPVGSTSIISPTQAINGTSGIGITVVPSATSSGGGHGTFYWNRFTPKTTGYRLKRVNGATTDYLVSSSGTFSTETTNSVSTTATTTVLTTANQWANGTTYTVSFATVSNCGTVPYGATRTLITTTPSAAPSSPTPRRFFRGTLVAATLGHEQTFDNNALVNRINVANKGTSATTFGLQIGDVYLVAPTTVNVGETLVVDTSQRVDAGDRTYLTAGASSTLDVYISGTEGI